MKNNYYDEIIAQIKGLIDEKKWSDALFFVKTELNVPYVPTEIEDQLLDLQKLILIEATDAFGDSAKFNEETFVQDLKSDDKAIRIAALMHIERLNALKFTSEFQELFASSFSNDEKTLLLIQLQNQKIDFDFEITKNNKKMKVNPSKFSLDNFMKLFKETSFIFSKIADEKNITEQNYFNDLVMTFINEFIPFEIKVGPWEIAVAVYKTIKDLMGEQFDKNEYIVEYELNEEQVHQTMEILELLTKESWG
jgi:hypothetical protein